jgi:hypothetical protein
MPLILFKMSSGVIMSRETTVDHDSVSADYLHRMSRLAKLSAGMVALTLHDIDGQPEHKKDAMKWLSMSDDAALSVATCSKALANLNAYLNHYGLDATPMAKDHDFQADAGGVDFSASTPLEAAEASAWLAAITDWSSEIYRPEERSAISEQLVEIVDQQVQACYSHLREQTFSMSRSNDYQGKTYGTSKKDQRDTVSVLVLDDMPSSSGPS